MPSDFKHPLARDSKVWPSIGFSGEPKDMLIVVTTLELDPSHGKFKKDKVDQLKRAAQAWITETHAAHDAVLVNRPKDWA